MELPPRTAAVYLERAFRRMLEVVEHLGEPRINERPHGPGTNAVASLVFHCCGVTEFWLGHVAFGRPSSRDREGEFSRQGTVEELRRLVERTLETAVADLDCLEAGEGTDEGGRQFLPGGDRSDASVVLHVIEELYQHLGHMELAADALSLDPAG